MVRKKAAAQLRDAWIHLVTRDYDKNIALRNGLANVVSLGDRLSVLVLRDVRHRVGKLRGQMSKVIQNLCKYSAPEFWIRGKLSLDHCYSPLRRHQEHIDWAHIRVELPPPGVPFIIGEASRSAWADHEFWRCEDRIPEPRLFEAEVLSRATLMSCLWDGHWVEREKLIAD